MLSEISRPAVWALSASTNLAVRIFGDNSDAEGEQPTAGDSRATSERLRRAVSGS
ncbi:hypothetical protein G7043_24930 [Lentzea sp. NEAU-D13]|uniref:Uncharacterized protein n=1 Tax=Lentzea alba TaxID=2714351 RepID=A0A7C9VYF7_9PSEU|nr:hypothetical protein [Lentzea alba]NGY62181.1 hypothetical protein [Lentzea alba]